MYYLRRILLLVCERYGDLIGGLLAARAAGDHRIVGDDIAVGRDQEARAAALLLLRDRLARPGKGVEPDAERDFLLGRDVYHRGLQLLDVVGKAFGCTGARHGARKSVV